MQEDVHDLVSFLVFLIEKPSQKNQRHLSSTRNSQQNMQANDYIPETPKIFYVGPSIIRIITVRKKPKREED
jgi:hypothetical protein